MSRTYRSWAERREIFRSVIADSNPKPLKEFQLTPSEEVYYRARATKAVAKLARASSSFKAYYALPTAKPFSYVLVATALTSASGIGAAIALCFWSALGHDMPYPLLGACLTIVAAAIGWSVVSWISHRNTVRQNTNNLLFSRFSQAPFGEALHRFHKKFGWRLDQPITTEMIKTLRATGAEEDIRAAAAMTYILNYFESICSGVLNGDLDKSIVENNVRGFICAYHDKCEPYIRTSNAANPRTFENLIKVRTHFREP